MSSGGVTAAVLAENEPTGLTLGSFIFVLLVFLVGLLALFSPKITKWSSKKARYYKHKAKHYFDDK